MFHGDSKSVRFIQVWQDIVYCILPDPNLSYSMVPGPAYTILAYYGIEHGTRPGFYHFTPLYADSWNDFFEFKALTTARSIGESLLKM
jgi:hypothetical protein